MFACACGFAVSPSLSGVSLPFSSSLPKWVSENQGDAACYRMPPGDRVAEGGTYAFTGQINILNNSACFNGKRNTKHFYFVSHEQTSTEDLLDPRTTNRTSVSVKRTSRNTSAFCFNRHTRHKGVIKTSRRFIVRESTQGHS